MAKTKIKGVWIRKGGYVYARIDGRQQSFGKGDKALELAQAAKAKEMAKAFELKQMGVGFKKKRPKFKTFRQMCNWYMTLPSIQEQAGYKRKVYAAKHLLAYFGSRSIYDIEGDDQERYHKYRLSKVGQHTVNFEIELLSAVYHKAIADKKIPADAKPGRFHHKKYNDPRPIVTEAQYKKLLEHASADFADFLKCGYETAMRSGEVRNLTAGQVHLDMIDISGEKFNYIDLGTMDTKNATRRTPPVSDTLKEVLKRRLKGLQPDDYMFTNDGRRWHPATISYNMKAVCEKAKLPHGDNTRNHKGEKIGIVYHCLRHTRTTLWVKMGFSDEIIRRATGHKTLEAYRTYVKLGPQSTQCLVKQSNKSVTKRLSLPMK
jgi:integrase